LLRQLLLLLPCFCLLQRLAPKVLQSHLQLLPLRLQLQQLTRLPLLPKHPAHKCNHYIILIIAGSRRQWETQLLRWLVSNFRKLLLLLLL
jgi:hypothetical protein